MEASTHNFEYQSLLLPSYIRLLTVLPGPFRSPVRCVLQTTLIRTDLGYEAISYVWGDATITSVISLAETSPGSSATGLQFRPFRITANLEVLLRYLRLANATRTIWVDAICINQGDLNERSIQVQCMRDVYCKASTVLVWLGRHSEPSDRTKRSDISSYDTADSHRERIVNAAFTYFRIVAASQQRSALLSEEVVQGIRLISRRPWWRRLWVIQEVSITENARNVRVMCGNEMASWASLGWAIDAMISTLESGPPALPRYEAIEDCSQMWMTHSRLSETSFTIKPFSEKLLLALCEVAGRYRMSEPRDILYGILGLVGPLPPHTLSALKPDYTTPLHQFYLNLAGFLLDDTGTAAILGPAARDSKRPEDLPTWVPIWSRKGALSPPPGIARLRDPSVRLSADGKQLHARGVDLGRISLVTTIAYSEDPAALRERLRTFERGALSLPAFQQRYHTFDAALQALRAFCARWLFPIGDKDLNVRLYKRLVGAAHDQASDPADPVQATSKDQEIAALARQIHPAAQRRLMRFLIVTSEGHLAGTSSGTARTACLEGIEGRIFFVPASECLIFQNKPSVPNGYGLVGSCTVQGYELKEFTAEDHLAVVEKEPLVEITVV